MTISGVKVKKADGTWVGGASKAPDVQDFTSSQDISVPEGGKRCFVELVGGGQGGTSTAPYLGGQGGSYASGLFDAADVDGATLTIGAGGGPNAAGGETTLGALCTARGGGWYPTNASSSTPTMCSDGGTNSRSSLYGAGGGASNVGGRGLGGTAAGDRLKAGDGGTVASDGISPGGGGGSRNGSSGPTGNGAPGAARITTYF